MNQILGTLLVRFFDVILSTDLRFINWQSPRQFLTQITFVRFKARATPFFTLKSSLKNCASLIQFTSFNQIIFIVFSPEEAEDCSNVFVFLWSGNSSDFPRGLISQRMKLTFLILFRENLFCFKYQVLKIFTNREFSLEF